MTELDDVLALLANGKMLNAEGEPNAAGHYFREFERRSADYLREHGSGALVDARRYRWWRENADCIAQDGGGVAGVAFACQINLTDGNYTTADLIDMIADAAIDAAQEVG